MRNIFHLFFLIWGFSGAALAQESSPEPILPEHFGWAGPPENPALQGAWLLGSEQGSGAYLLRVRLDSNGRIAPHVHPDTRNSTVLSGTLYVGFGEIFDPDQLVAVPKGGVYVAPAGVMHYLWAKDGRVEYQESGTGPTATMWSIPDTGPVPEQTGPLSTLSWLAGCWGAEGAETGSGEQWSLPAGGSMFGTSRTIKNGKVVGYETMRIQFDEEGNVVFTAHPFGQEEASFKLASLSRRDVVFENPAHDFPQRISYQLRFNGNLLAQVEGKNQGERHVIDFPMKRISCEARLQTDSVPAAFNLDGELNSEES